MADKKRAYVVTRKHVNLRDDKGVPYSPDIGDEVKLTDREASRVVNKVRLKDDAEAPVLSAEEKKLAKHNDSLVAQVAELEESLVASGAKVAELEALVQSQAAEIAKQAKGK